MSPSGSAWRRIVPAPAPAVQTPVDFVEGAEGPRQARADPRSSLGYLPDLRADLRVERAQRVEHRVHGARSGLKDRGRVERDPLKAHRLELDDAASHAVVLCVEAPTFGVLWRRRDHALEPDGAGIAAGRLRVAADRLEGAPGACRVGDAAREPAVAELAHAAHGGRGHAAGPDGDPARPGPVRFHGP